MNEIEVKILNVDHIALINKLESLGATRIFDQILDADFYINENKKKLRIRKLVDQNILTYKEKILNNEVMENIEFEISFDNYKNFKNILNHIGFNQYGNSKKHRISYKLNDIEFDFDKYDNIPCLVEIESNSLENVVYGVELIGYKMSDTCTFTESQVMKHYGVNKSNKIGVARLSFYSNRNIVDLKSGQLLGYYWIRQVHCFEFAKQIYTYIMNKSDYDFEVIVSQLKEGLDRESIDFIDNFILRIKLIYHNNLIAVEELFSEKEISDYTIVEQNLNNKFDSYNIKLPIENRCRCVFYYNYGLHEIPNNKEYLTNKIIIDCGAYVGDSAIMFFKELGSTNKIYAFEIHNENYNHLLQSIELNNLKEYIIPINKGISGENGFLNIGNSGVSAYLTKNEGSEKIEVIKIDSYFQGIEVVGLIKFDIEGSEYAGIIGAKETILKYKPILLISIYHTGKDFFEIKTLIDSWKLGYKFKVRKFKPGSPTLEVILIAYQ